MNRVPYMGWEQQVEDANVHRRRESHPAGKFRNSTPLSPKVPNSTVNSLPNFRSHHFISHSQQIKHRHQAFQNMEMNGPLVGPHGSEPAENQEGNAKKFRMKPKWKSDPVKIRM